MIRRFPWFCGGFGLLLWAALGAPAEAAEAPLKPVPVGSVQVEGGYWGPWVTRNAEVTLPHNFAYLEENGNLPDFDRAAGKEVEGPYRGHAPNDSNVFKVLEGAAWSLLQRPELVDEAAVAKQVERVMAPQQKDGYLCTEFILKPDEDRWGSLRSDHVLYSAGHLLEAGVAWKQATGRENLLQASRRYADLIDASFGEGKRLGVPGHQEIEMALIRLYDETGEQRYLELSRFFLEQRGHLHGQAQRVRGEKPRSADYNQDRVPLAELREARGHAVRAGYTYAAMADMELRDPGGSAYDASLDALWRDVVERKSYLTGASATAQFHDEGFGEPYVLPMAHGYAETCASVAAVMWNHRMALLKADAKYADVMERTLHNAVMSGISLSGDRFFYTNPLASRGPKQRAPRFNPACCPTNLVRVIPQVGAWAYGVRGQEVFVNLFVAGEAQLELGEGSVSFRVETEYPHEGRVRLTITEADARDLSFALRVPGWAREQPVPGSLYRFLGKSDQAPRVTVVGQPQRASADAQGYLRLKREWQVGDRIELELPMPIRRVVADERVEDCRGKVALQRGPVVYCLEAVDHGGVRTNAVVLADEAKLEALRRDDLLGGTVVISGEAALLRELEWGREVQPQAIKLQAIPYALWANREPGYMDVWLARSPAAAVPIPAATALAEGRLSDSAAKPAKRLRVLHDGRFGPRSDFREVPRYTWGPDERFIHIRDFKQQQERLAKQPPLTGGWLQCEWDEPRLLQRTAVYWAVDRAKQVYWWTRVRGLNLDLPQSWQLLYRDGETWKPVTPRRGQSPQVVADTLYELRFEPVLTDAVRLQVKFGGHPAAVMEWKLE